MLLHQARTLGQCRNIYIYFTLPLYFFFLSSPEPDLAQKRSFHVGKLSGGLENEGIAWILCF